MTDHEERLDGCAGGAHSAQPGLRPLVLPAPAAGALFLTGLPDSAPRLARFLGDAATADVTHVVILTEEHEIRDLARAYAGFLATPPLPFALTRFGIRDFGIPEDIAGFRATAGRIAAALARGERMVMHCRGGIGRTGMMAQAVLIELGLPPEQAARQVAEAGSRCETARQAAFLREAYADAAD